MLRQASAISGVRLDVIRQIEDPTIDGFYEQFFQGMFNKVRRLLEQTFIDIIFIITLVNTSPSAFPHSTHSTPASFFLRLLLLSDLES